MKISNTTFIYTVNKNPIVSSYPHLYEHTENMNRNLDYPLPRIWNTTLPPHLIGHVHRMLLIRCGLKGNLVPVAEYVEPPTSLRSWVTVHAFWEVPYICGQHVEFFHFHVMAQFTSWKTLFFHQMKLYLLMKSLSFQKHFGF